MKKKIIIIAILIGVFFVPYQAIAQPKVEVDNAVYTFDSVFEGGHVFHEFIIRNIGDTLLTIEKVLPP